MRELFLLDPDVIFLNHGSFGACPAPVFTIYQRWQRELERQPVEFLGRRSADLLRESRRVLAAYLGTDAANLVYLSNATTGVNTVARSLDLQPGDEILTTDHEYGACDNAWTHVTARTGAHYVKQTLPLPFDPDAFADALWAAVTPRTRLIYLSHITSPTALILPIAEVIRRAREAGILTLIDGAHAPGQIPLALDALGADFYTGNLHKWLCAPKGAAFLYARPEHHALLDALVISWGYSPPRPEGDAYTGTGLFERRHQWQGTRDIAAFLAVPEAIAFQQAHDWDAVRARCHAQVIATQDQINARTGLDPIAPAQAFAQMAAVPLPPVDAEALKARLYDEFRVEVPITGYGGRHFVRVSVQGYNTQADTDALVAALSVALAGTL